MLSEMEVGTLGIDHLFFDYNSMIHPCAQEVLGKIREQRMAEGLDTGETAGAIDKMDIVLTQFIEIEIIRKTIEYTQYVIGLLNPKTVHIVIDGVAPRAKINQQRERRYKSFFFKQLETNTKSLWDSNKITPGTFFMAKLIEELEGFTKDMNDRKERTVLLSDSDQCGEGEHKMMKYINENINGRQNSNLCIYGLDADLIMLSLKSKMSDSIILLRDNTFNTQLREENRSFTYLDIKTLKGCVYKDILNELGNESGGVSMKQIIDDYIFLCFLLGNDFLEHIPNLIIKENGANTLMKVYIKNLKLGLRKPGHNYLTSIGGPIHGQINLSFLTSILGDLAKSETYFFSNLWSVYNTARGSQTQRRDPQAQARGRGPECEERYFYENGDLRILFLKDDCIKYNTADYKRRYYFYYGINDVEDACRQYLLGLFWTWGYYNNHEHDNWTWYYPYHATPLVTDIYEYLSKNTGQFRDLLQRTPHLQQSTPNTTLEQILMVLPRESLLGILSEDESKADVYTRLLHFFRSESPDIQKHFPKTIVVDLIHKEQLWQSKVLFEHFDKKILSLLT